MKITEAQQKALNNKLFELDSESLSIAVDIEKLLDSGADVNALDPTSSETILHKIARTDNSSAVELLLNKGVDPLKTNRYRELALQCAALHGYISVVECLLKTNISEQILHEDKYGQSALHKAVFNGHTSVAECLLKYNPSEQVLHEDDAGHLALQCAAFLGHTSVVECLLKINPLEQALHKDKYGRTAIHSAALEGQASVIEVFLNYLPIDQHLEMYQSALEFSKENDHANCIAVIEQALLQHAINEDLSNSELSQERTVIAIKNRRRL